jgi:hypothetical protein
MLYAIGDSFSNLPHSGDAEDRPDVEDDEEDTALGR